MSNPNLPNHVFISHHPVHTLFAPEDHHGLSKAIDEILRQDLVVLSEKARKEAERWGWSVPTAELVEMYQRLHRERQRAL